MGKVVLCDGGEPGGLVDGYGCVRVGRAECLEEVWPMEGRGAGVFDENESCGFMVGNGG